MPAYDINFINELGNPYNYLAQDSDGRESVKFGIYGIPESILVDKNLRYQLDFKSIQKQRIFEMISLISPPFYYIQQ